MLAIIILLFISAAAFLLSRDNKGNVALDDICWLNSPDDLSDVDLFSADCPHYQMSQEWSRLWDCTGQVLRARFHRHKQRLAAISPSPCQRVLCCRKRDELRFSFRISSLRQLIACRHASGADCHHAGQPGFIHKAQCAFSPLCFFLSEQT